MILTSFCKAIVHFSFIFFFLSAGFSQLTQICTILPLKNCQNYHQKKKEKKESITCFGPISIYRLKQPDFADTTSIFSGTKQRGYLYPFTSRYGIYRLVWYGIDFLVCDWGHTYEDHSNITFLYYAISKINKYGIWEYLKRVEDVLN